MTDDEARDCDHCGMRISLGNSGIRWLAIEGGPGSSFCAPSPDTWHMAKSAPSPGHAAMARLIEDLRTAANLLDSEEHRYVERFDACPQGCEFDPATGRRTAGPDPCPEECFMGTVEDEDAVRMDPLINSLRQHADVLETGLTST